MVGVGGGAPLRFECDRDERTDEEGVIGKDGMVRPARDPSFAAAFGFPIAGALDLDRSFRQPEAKVLAAVLLALPEVESSSLPGLKALAEPPNPTSLPSFFNRVTRT